MRTYLTLSTCLHSRLIIRDDSSTEYSIADLQHWAVGAAHEVDVAAWASKRGPDGKDHGLMHHFVYQTTADVLVLLDSDLVVAYDWWQTLERLMALASPSCLAIASKRSEASCINNFHSDKLSRHTLRHPRAPFRIIRCMMCFTSRSAEPCMCS